MPGFMVNGVGQGADGQPKAYLSYTWYIGTIFDEAVSQTGGDPLIYVRDATLPTFSVTKEQIQGASLEYKFAKSVSWDDVRLVFYDTEGLLDTLKEWRQNVWDPSTGLANPSDYKKNTTLTTVLPTGESANSWQLVNSWPSTIRYGDLTYTQSDAKVVDVTVTYDWAIENPA
jgi:hypothetical protein